MLIVKNINLDDTTNNQINRCIELFQTILGESLAGVYLYGSAILGGLQKYSDIDLFVVSHRNLTISEKPILVQNLLSISGIYKKEEKRPIEATFVNINEIKPWTYPPVFDFQYGEWLRGKFDKGDINPWPNKTMPDLAVLITQVLSSNYLLYGKEANSFLPIIPHKDLCQSMLDELDAWVGNIKEDTTNVLLALARIWITLETGKICSKLDAADSVIQILPKEYKII